MTNKLILTIFSGLIIALGSVQPARAQQKLSAENAKRLEEFVNSGFQIRYEVAGKTSTAYTWGNKSGYLRTEKSKLDNGIIKVSAVTDDKALEIVTHFIFDEKKQRVIIDRKVRNISSETVNVQMLSAYVDLKLVSGSQNADAKLDLEQNAWKRIRAGHLIYKALKHRPDSTIFDYFKECGGCDPPPILCLTINCLPEEKYNPARWYLSPGDQGMILWDSFIMPPLLTAPAEGAFPGNEHHSVIVFG